MKRSLVIFGTGEIAQLAHYYFNTDSEYDVVAFTVDAPYLKELNFNGLPVVAFENITTQYPPEQYDLFIALSYNKLNVNRKNKCLLAKKLGYSLPSFISSHATVLNDGCIGQNCFIFEEPQETRIKRFDSASRTKKWKHQKKEKSVKAVK